MTQEDLRLNDDKARAEIAHLNAMTAKLLAEIKYYPYVIVAIPLIIAVIGIYLK